MKTIITAIIFTLCITRTGLTQSPRPAYVPEDAVLAVINDPDGQTNVRAAASPNSRIVATIVDGERFWALPGGGWRRVWLTTGENGFMDSKRVAELRQEDSNRQVKIVSKQTEERQADGRQSEWRKQRDKLLIEALKTFLPTGNR